MTSQTVDVAEVRRSRFEQLQTALSEGWRIQSPVYLRAQWFVPHRDGYYFVLSRGNEVDLIVVPAVDEVRQWVKAQRLHLIVT